VDEVETIQPQLRARGGATQRVLGLTVLAHHDITRVGEQARLPTLEIPGREVELSRNGPLFGPAYGEGRQGLATPFVSRKPVRLSVNGAGDVVVDVSATSTEVEVNGQAVRGRAVVSGGRLEPGIVLTLAGTIVLLLHRQRLGAPTSAATHGLVGASSAVVDLRGTVERVAASSAPVLVRGETGVGKELVAQALHAAGPRAGKPCVVVNLGAIAPSLAASELFGHVRGAFSGAVGDKPGVFERADGGTLFLDEIGETPSDVQPMLLRALESGEIQRVGDTRTRRVDVRLVAATDADLHAMAAEGRFRAPLIYRLASHEIAIPPLRERRDDVGRLLRAFLMEELAPSGRAGLLMHQPGSEPWLPGTLVARLVLYGWPGNVRQLRNVARYLASLDAPSADDPQLERLLHTPTHVAEAPTVTPAPTTAALKAPKRKPSDIGDDELATVLQEHAYQLGKAAKALGISRPSMNQLVDRHPTLRRANDLTAAEVMASQQRHGGDIDAMWRELRVSKRGLKLRIAELGL